MYENLYDIIREGCQSSAFIVMGELAQQFRLPRCLDVGCGEGWWAYWAKKSGLSDYVAGIDNDGFDAPCKAELDAWVKADFANRTVLFSGDRYDLTICLEMAEHLPESRADDLVRFLCNSSKELILFSAAIPGQGGMGHINEQWPSYWLEKFNALGWFADGSYRDIFWDNKSVEPWYSQNMFVLDREINTNFDDSPKIHPAFWSTRTGVPLP